MKKRIKALVLVLVLALGCFTMTACGPSQEDVTGIWSGAYVYEGNTFSSAFELESDGTYLELTYKNGQYYSLETGTYDIKGRKVSLHKDGNTGVSTVYKYKNGTLVNNGHEYTRD